MGSDVLGGFLKGFTAGWAMMTSKDEREYNRAKTEYMKAQAEYYRTGKTNTMRDANYASQIADRAAAAGDRKRRTDAYVANAGKDKTKDKDDIGLDDPDVAGAIPTDPYADPSMDAADDFTTDPEEAVPTFSQGGVVPPPKRRKKLTRYANGGGVVSEEEDEEPMPAGMEPMPLGMPMTTQPPRPNAIPQVGLPPTGGTPPPGAEKPPVGFSYAAAIDAAAAGLEDMGKEHGLDKDEAVPGPDGDKKVKAYQEDQKDAASPEQVEQLRQKFDPERRLSMDQVNSKVLGSVYEIYLRQGNAAKATKAAAALVKHYKMMDNRYRAIAEKAAAGGKVDEAAMAMLKAYAYIPDGHEVELQKTKSGRYAFRYTDQKTGQVIARGLKTPQEILSMATHGGIPSFEELVAASAGDPTTAALQPPSATAQLEDTRRTDQAATARVDTGIGTGAGTKESPFRVTSQKELDQLPAGTWVSINGRVGQKQAPKAAP